MILVDTSAWIRHLHARDLRLVEWLEQDRVVTCDVVVGELRLGAGLPREVGDLLAHLPHISCASAPRTLAFVDRHRRALVASGVGWSDVQIIATSVDAGALLHTHDVPMKRSWKRLGFRVP